MSSDLWEREINHEVGDEGFLAILASSVPGVGARSLRVSRFYAARQMPRRPTLIDVPIDAQSTRSDAPPPAFALLVHAAILCTIRGISL